MAKLNCPKCPDFDGFAITAICTFGNEGEDYSNVNIKKKWIVIPGIIILCWILFLM